MKYLEDMCDKFGFQDGEVVPVGIRSYRDVYVRVLNHLLPQFGSGVRAVAYDRPGMHNSCMILFVSQTFFDPLASADVLSGDVSVPDDGFADPDEGYDQAVTYLDDNDIDVDQEFLQVSVKIRESWLRKFMAKPIPAK